MQKIRAKITVFFEDPFWVGVYERICDGNYQICKVTFGCEPKDYQVYDFFMENWQTLQFSKPVKLKTFPEKHINPKRMRREISKNLQKTGIGTKAQQALKLQHEQHKLEGRQQSRRDKREAKQEQFELKQKRKKEKKNGH